MKGGVTTGLVGTGGGWVIEVTVGKSGSSHPHASFSFMKSTAKVDGTGGRVDNLWREEKVGE